MRTTLEGARESAASPCQDVLRTHLARRGNVGSMRFSECSVVTLPPLQLPGVRGLILTGPIGHIDRVVRNPRYKRSHLKCARSEAYSFGAGAGATAIATGGLISSSSRYHFSEMTFPVFGSRSMWAGPSSR